MERTRKVDKRPLWIKLGGGSMHLPNRLIKPGQKFRAYDYEIPVAFRNLVERVFADGDTAPVVETVDEIEKKESPQKEDVETTESPEPPKKPKYAYDVVQTSIGWYNVLDKAGKVMNDKAMRKAEAEALQIALSPPV